MSCLGHYRLIMNSGMTKPSPSVGQVLGPLGINSMNFIKEFNARTSQIRPDIPLQVTIVPSSDKQFKFSIRTPQSKWFLLRAARVHTASSNGALSVSGCVTLKEIYHIAEIKCMDPQFIGASLRSICVSLIGTAKAMGLHVDKELPFNFQDRDDTRIIDLPKLRKENRSLNKVGKRNLKK